MKKLALIVSLATVFGFAGHAQAAATGTVTFNGLLTANTCDVTVDGQAADATITLPTVGIAQLSAPTNTAGETGFVMALENCTGGTLTTASAFFEAGPAVDLTTGRLKNTSSGGANNVSLQLLDGSSSSRSVINVGNSDQTINTAYVTISGGSAVLPYSVRYYAEGTTTPGVVTSNVVYSIQYQ